MSPPPYSIDAVPRWRPRWWLELREVLSIWRVILSFLPLGRQPRAGFPVLLVPGFVAGDWSLRPAGRFLRKLGYATYTAGIRSNVDCTTRMVALVERRAVELATRRGSPIALVGHSRGGTIVRIVAARQPTIVSKVVTLGAPLTHQFAANEHVLATAEAMAYANQQGVPGLLNEDCLRGACAKEISEELATPLPTSTQWTSIYTRSDGIVIWRSCLIPGTDQVRVSGGHNGLISNSVALAATARALGQPSVPRAANDAAAQLRTSHHIQGGPTMNLADNLVTTATTYPDLVAVKLDDHELTYAQLLDKSSRVAGWLKSLGVKPGDRVGVILPNLPQMPIVYYGILLAGGVVVPMNPLYKSREIGYSISDSKAKALFAWNAVTEEATKAVAGTDAHLITVDPATFDAEVAAHDPIGAVARQSQDTAVILYTSGTTGTPKGAELTHANMTSNAKLCADESILGVKTGDMVFGGLPLFHSFGQTVMMNAAILVGATLTLLPRFHPDKALELIQRDRVTLMGGVPTMYVELTHFAKPGDYDTSTLRRCVSGGAALPVEILRGFEKIYGAPILEGYGLSETSPVAAFNHADRERKPGSVGQPVDGVQFKLINDDWSTVAEGEVGEIAIKGPNVMKGYLNKPEATAEVMHDGWFRTGDIGRRDKDGYYYIVDRSKDMIIRGGYNIYPREIEEVLYEHPAVASAAVVGVPDKLHGEEVAAAVVLKDGAHATPEELRDFAKARVAAYKYPRIIWLTDALPMGATGKILKREIHIPDKLVEEEQKGEEKG